MASAPGGCRWRAAISRPITATTFLLVNLNEKPIERITPNEGRSVRRVLGYNGNGVHYRRKCEEVASDGYREFAFR
jgi:hypothetical protein